MTTRGMRVAALMLTGLVRCNGLSTATPPAQDSLKAGLKIHQEECQYGFDNFGRSPSADERTFTDDQFEGHAVGERNCGPDKLPKNGDVVFQSKEPLVSLEECQALVDEARQKITDELAEKEATQDGDDIPTNSELGEAKVSTLPDARDWLQEKMHSTLFPLLRNRFGLSDNLTLHDALIIGYGYFGGGSKSQPVHRDSSIVSLNIALSPRSDYEGGGTYFEALPQMLHQEQGHVTCHSGGTMHAGRGIDSGERWVLVLFVLDEDRPQLARRCHALGLEAQRGGQIQEAKTHFDAALTECANNHLIYKDMGRTFMQESNIAKARHCLSKTAELYPLDVGATMALANMMLQANRPRAALRRLNTMLTNSPLLSDEAFFSPDTWQSLRSQGWEARLLSASCAIQCAQRAPASCTQYLPTAALQRLDVCRQAAPGAPNLPPMMQAAQELLERYEDEASGGGGSL